MKNEIQEIIKLIEKHDSISLFMHKRPDGDSISSSYGLALAILEKYPDKDVKIVSDIEFMKENFKFIDWKEEIFTLENKATLAIMGDGCQDDRIWFYEEFAKSEDKILYDHHQNKENIKANIFWHEPTYPASAMQAYEIAKELQEKFSEQTSLSLLLGILSDTGFFKYSGVNKKAPAYFSDLLTNVTFDKINDFYNRMFVRTKADIELQTHVFEKIRYDGRVAYCVFDKEEVDKYKEHNLKMKINSIGHIEGTDIWAFIYWSEEKKIWKFSLRSKGPVVSDVATKYDGGGHLKAAACKVYKKEDIKKVLKDLNEITRMAG